jgi:flagellin-like hook-associated protein FlgL
MKIAGGDSRAVAYFDFTATPSTYSAAAFFWSFTIQNIEPGTGVSLVFDAPNGEKISMTINDSLGVTDSGGIQGVFIAGLGTVWTHNVTDIHGRHGLEISIEPARDIIGNISGERDISYNGRWFISVDNSNADITADIDFAMYGLFSTSEGFFAAGFIEYETYSSDGGSNNGQNQTPDYHNRGLVLQIGDRNSVMQRVYVQLPDMTSAAIGLADISVLTVESALDSINKIDVANRAVSRERAYFGAMQNRLEHTANSLTTTTENLTSSESQIRDTDMAAEMLKYTKYNILQQAAQALLAQANQSPQGILQLLK